jgi:hypothetical protein
VKLCKLSNNPLLLLWGEHTLNLPVSITQKVVQTLSVFKSDYPRDLWQRFARHRAENANVQKFERLEVPHIVR